MLKMFFYFLMALPVATMAQSVYRMDVESPDQIVKVVYEVISGPAGQDRDWDRFLNLFDSTATMCFYFKVDSGSKFKCIAPSVYAKTSGPRMKDTGFYEREISRRQTRYGNIVQVQSAYAFRYSEEGADLQRGVNFLDIIYRNDRWYILHILWQPETDDLPLPAEFMK